jgi:hypothetical protein
MASTACPQIDRPLRLLEKKFGPLPPAAVAKVKRASGATLDRWADRIPTADSLDEMFAE